MLCSRCLGPLEYAGSRTRRKRYTGEDGPAVETIVVAVGHCLEDGHYSTIFPDDVVRSKQYCISDIRSVLENKEDYSLASPRTRAYWRSWFRSVWDAVVRNLQLCIGGILSEHDISIALHAFRKECGDGWLRYVLDLFSTGLNNLCMYFDILGATIGPRGGKPRGPQAQGGADAPHTGRKPPKGG